MWFATQDPRKILHGRTHPYTLLLSFLTLAKRKTNAPVPPISCSIPWRVLYSTGWSVFRWWESSTLLWTSFELKGLWEGTVFPWPFSLITGSYMVYWPGQDVVYTTARLSWNKRSFYKVFQESLIQKNPNHSQNTSSINWQFASTLLKACSGVPCGYMCTEMQLDS